MKRVVYFSDAGSIYDDFFVRKLSESFDVSLVTFNKNPSFVPPSRVRLFVLPEVVGKLPAHDAPRIYSTMPLKALLLRTWVDRLEPDALIGCSTDYGMVSALSGFKPFVWFVWGSEVLILPRLLPFRAMVRFMLRRADLVVLDSVVQFEACVKLGCNPEKIVRLPWVDTNELATAADRVEVRHEKFRTSLGWSAHDVVTICTRSHAPVYDVERIVRAIPAVVTHSPTARFLLVGRGPLTTSLKQLVDRLGVAENVHFTGLLGHDALLACLRNSDIYVSSSLSDGTSASLIEAMTIGLPCVVTNIPGNNEWINDGENGLLFAPGDSEGLARLLVDLIDDDNLRARLGRAAQRTSLSKGSWASNVPKLVSAIADLGARGR